MEASGGEPVGGIGPIEAPRGGRGEPGLQHTDGLTDTLLGQAPPALCGHGCVKKGLLIQMTAAETQGLQLCCLSRSHPDRQLRGRDARVRDAE